MADFKGTDPLLQPLTAKHYDSLIEAERRYHDLLPQFDKAEGCGIMCDQMRRSATAQYNRVRQFIATYFPNGRPPE